MSSRQQHSGIASLLFFVTCTLHCVAPITVAQQASVDSTPGGDVSNGLAQSSKQTTSTDIEGMFQKCGQDGLYLALRNIGMQDVSWPQIDDLLGGARTCTMDQLQLAAESLGAYTAPVRIRGDALRKLARLGSKRQPFSVILYLEPDHRFHVGHFVVVPWVRPKSLYYLDPGYGRTVVDIHNFAQDRDFLCLLISNEPLDLASLQGSFSRIGPGQGLVLVLGLCCIVAGLVLGRRKLTRPATLDTGPHRLRAQA